MGEAVRYVANGTFTIYLMHHPLLVLATTLHLFRPESAALTLSSAIVIVGALILVAAPVDTFKNAIRKSLLTWTVNPGGVPAFAKLRLPGMVRTYTTLHWNPHLPFRAGIHRLAHPSGKGS